MAPEQVTNAPLDRRTDLYAAAVVLWETLTGAKLVHGASEAAVVQQILTGKRRPPSALNPNVPPALDEIVMRGLAQDPNARFASAREMALAIERTVPIAGPAEIGAWVRATCNLSIDVRAQMIAAIEARSSTQNLQMAVDSLRHMSTPNIAVQPVQTIPPPPQVPIFGSAPPARVQSAPPRDGTGGGVQLPVAGAPGSSRAALLIAAALFGILAAGAIVAAFLVMRKSRAAPVVVSDAAMPSASSSTAAGAASSPSIASVAAVPPTCPEGMVLIPGGRFFMGSDDDLPDEKPAHHVTIFALCMDRFEVTAAAYKECSERGDCKRAGTTNKWQGITARDAKTYDPVCTSSADDRGNHPINCVDWSMADRYCKANGKRLPTEAEWEFAARGSDGRKYPWGDAPPSYKHLNACGSECTDWLKKSGAPNDGLLYSNDDGFPTTAPVGSFPMGEDIVGNVWEWVADYYGGYAGDDVTDPKGPPSGTSRVVRGGAWNGAQADWVRPSFRFHLSPETRSHGVGFRCVK
jgi:formylglycine-generating enzyme required for sulfatase activity